MGSTKKVDSSLCQDIQNYHLLFPYLLLCVAYFLNIFFFKHFFVLSSDFSDLPDMTDEYIELSVIS